MNISWSFNFGHIFVHYPGENAYGVESISINSHSSRIASPKASIKTSPSSSFSGSNGFRGAIPYPCSLFNAYSTNDQLSVHQKPSRIYSLIARIPPGTAAASARARIPWILFASLRSVSVANGKFSRYQSLIEAAGTKLGIPLTVPWPPHFIQGVISAIRPSSNKNGNFRVSFIVGSSEIRVSSRISFPMLPPHLFSSALLFKRRKDLENRRQFHSTQISCFFHNCTDNF